MPNAVLSAPDVRPSSQQNNRSKSTSPSLKPQSQMISLARCQVQAPRMLEISVQCKRLLCSMQTTRLREALWLRIANAEDLSYLIESYYETGYFPPNCRAVLFKFSRFISCFILCDTIVFVQWTSYREICEPCISHCLFNRLTTISNYEWYHGKCEKIDLLTLNVNCKFLRYELFHVSTSDLNEPLVNSQGIGLWTCPSIILIANFIPGASKLDLLTADKP